MKKLRVTVEGKAYEVLVEMFDDAVNGASAPPMAVAAPVRAATVAAPAPAAPAPAVAVATAASAPAAGPGAVPSPLAGKVVSIDVVLGQAVPEGAQLATIEAMKMNTYIYAPVAGKVLAIAVNPGDAVEEGAPLLRLG